LKWIKKKLKRNKVSLVSYLINDKENKNMAIKKTTGTSNVATQTINTPVAESTGVISLEKVEDTRKTYDLALAKDKYKQEILASGLIDKLTSTIDLENTNTILEFGKEPATRMAQVADQVLSKYDMANLNGTSQLVDALLTIMKKIDIGELEDAKTLLASQAKKTFLDRFKKSAQEKLDALVGKYRTLGGDMEKIITQLTTYETQIKNSNVDIDRMYDQAIQNFKELMGFVLAGEQACTEIEQYKGEVQQEFAETGNPDLQFKLQNINQALTLMEQRTSDLRSAEAIALQAIPEFKIQEYTNANLARKINSAFIVTVPAFKNALVSSVIAKQQAIQNQGLSALDEATSMLIRKKAENAVQQLKNSQQLANSSAVKADDIEYAWNVIMNGIQEYKQLEEQYRNVRKEEAKRIEEANTKYLDAIASGQGI